MMGAGMSYRPKDDPLSWKEFLVEHALPFGIVVGVCILIIWGAVTVHGWMAEDDERRRAEWAGAKIVRICFDGTHIFRMRDGSYRTSWSSIPVESTDVCSTEKP